MKKKIVTMLVASALLASAMGTTALAAGSASVSISNYTSVQQGGSYTYTITVKITSSMDFIGSIKFSGIFSHEPIYLDYHPSSNSSKTLTSKVTFKIPANAALDSTGKITVSGQGDYLDGDGSVKEFSVSKSLTAKVVAPAVSTPKPASASTASKKPSASSAASTVTAPAPTATPAPGEWDIAANRVASAEAGGTLNVDAAKNPKIPATLLAQIKDQRGKLAVDLGSCTCTIDGAAMANIPNVDSIDLTMTMDKNGAISQAAGGADIYQLHFAYHGQLPGPFAYTFKAGKSKPGDTLYLYYYYGESGLIEGIQSAAVDENGYVTFGIYHCSSYVVAGGIIPGAVGSLGEAAAGRQAAQEAQAELTSMEGQLAAAQDEAMQLRSQLAQRESPPAAAQGDVEAYRAEAETGLGLTPEALAAGACALVLVSMLLTMLIGRIGPFKKRAARHGRAYKWQPSSGAEPLHHGK
jgi:hypothetical protein